MRRIRRRLAILLATALLAVAALGLTAGPTSASCTQAVGYFWTGSNGTGQLLTVCYHSNVFDLSSIGWNDQFSSVQFYDYTVNTAICLWTDAGYGGAGLRFLNDQSTPYNLPSPWNNRGSSIEWGNNCLAAGVSGVP